MHPKSICRFWIKLSLVFILALFSVSPLIAQYISIADLELELSQAEEDSNKVYLYYQIAHRLVYTQPEKSMKYALDGEKLSEKLKFSKGKVLALHCLGNLNWAKGNLREGISFFIKSKDLAKEIGDKNLIAKNIGSMGLIYRAAGNYEAALLYYHEALPIFLELNNAKRTSVVYNNIGKCYMEMGILDSATNYFELAIPLAEKSFPEMMPHLGFNHSDALFRQKKYAYAEGYLVKSLESALKYNDERTVIRGTQLLAQIRLTQGKVIEAESLAKETIEKAEHTNLKEDYYKSYATLSEVYSVKNDFKSAFYYLTLFNAYQDSIHNENSRQRLDFLNFEQQQNEILLLTKEKAMEKAMGQRQRYSIYILSVLLVIIAILAYILYRGRHRKSAANKLLQLKNEEIEQQKEEMSAQANKLQNLNQLKNKLFSIISHDLRSPLNTLSGSLNLVQNGLIDRDDFKAFLPELIKNVSYTTTLLDNLLHWAKNQLEGTEINPEKVNLKKLANLKTELLLHQADHKNIALINQVKDDVYVLADEIMIQIVIQNLLSNAIKFCNSGDIISLSLLTQDDYAIIRVTDTGMGIDEDNLQKLFNVTSFSTRGTANEKGTGLGLMLCKDFIEKNGGRIWAESILNEGSSFYFSLKLYDHQAGLKVIVDSPSFLQ